MAKASYLTNYYPNMYLGNEYYFEIYSYDSSHLHKVVIKCGSYSKTFEKVKGGVETKFTVPLEWAKAMPNATSLSGTITCTTYQSNYSTIVGSNDVETVKFYIGASALKPNLEVSIVDEDSNITNDFGGFVQLKSKLKVDITASGQYGATIKSYKTTFNGVTYSSDSFTTNPLSVSGTYDVVTIVTDSRGKTTTLTNSIYIYPYAHPKIISFSTTRADENGNPTTKGLYLLANVNFNIHSVNDINDCSYSIEYKLKDETTWTILESGSKYILNKSIKSSGAILNANASYDTRLVINDYFKEVVALGSVGTSFKLIHYNANGKALGFGKMSEKEEGVEFGIQAYFDRPIIIGNENKVLWSGSNVMLGTDRVELTEKVEEQQNGIVLVFSNASGDYQFNSFFVPKDFVLAHLGLGSQFIMTGGVFEKIGTKYLYINNAYITGHDNNGLTGTRNGITYDNQNFALRYVIGV